MFYNIQIILNNIYLIVNNIYMVFIFLCKKDTEWIV